MNREAAGAVGGWRQRSRLIFSRLRHQHCECDELFQSPPVLAEALAERGYAEPTAVQAAVLDPQAEGRDLVVSAQTGSGKTVAFGLAMTGELLGEDGKAVPAVAPLALVIAPTRELALQVSRELMWLYGKTGGRVATCVGGMDPSKERRALRAGAQIVVGTPGRLRDHLERGALDLSALRAVVLDEADEMLDMGFREDLEEILDATPESRRTLLFSATMPRPIVALAKRYQRDALRISTVGDDRGHGDIAYQAVTVSPSEIEQAVVNLLRFHEAETAMLFCATRDNVRHLHATLQERGFAAVALVRRAFAIRAQPRAAGAARPAGAGLRRHRRRRARARPADPEPGDPRRDSARCGGASASLRPDRPRRQEGHGGADRALSPAPAGRIDAAGREDPGRMARRARRRTRSARRIASGCWRRCSSRSSSTRRIARWPGGCSPNARLRISPPRWSAPTAPRCPSPRR